MSSADKKMRSEDNMSTNEEEMRRKAIREMMSSAVWAAIAVGCMMHASADEHAFWMAIAICAAANAAAAVLQRTIGHLGRQANKSIMRSYDDDPNDHYAGAQCRNMLKESLRLWRSCWSRESPYELFTMVDHTSTMVDHGR